MKILSIAEIRCSVNMLRLTGRARRGYAAAFQGGFLHASARGRPDGEAHHGLIVFFNIFQGARSVDAELIHSARFLGAGEFALIGVVVGEFLGGESGGGLGYLIILSLGTLNAADMMVALVALGVIRIVTALGIKQVEPRLLRWRPEYRVRA